MMHVVSNLIEALPTTVLDSNHFRVHVKFVEHRVHVRINMRTAFQIVDHLAIVVGCILVELLILSLWYN